jgi:hypothetical protein
LDTSGRQQFVQGSPEFIQADQVARQASREAFRRAAEDYGINSFVADGSGPGAISATVGNRIMLELGGNQQADITRYFEGVPKPPVAMDISVPTYGTTTVATPFRNVQVTALPTVALTVNTSQGSTVVDPSSETARFIQWQGSQYDPNNGGTVAQTWARQGISDPYSNPAIVGRAVEQTNRADNRTELFNQSGVTPPAAQIAPWNDPNWPAYQGSNREAYATASAALTDANAKNNLKAENGWDEATFQSWALRSTNPEEWGRQAAAANAAAGIVAGPGPAGTTGLSVNGATVVSTTGTVNSQGFPVVTVQPAVGAAGAVSPATANLPARPPRPSTSRSVKEAGAVSAIAAGLAIAKSPPALLLLSRTFQITDGPLINDEALQPVISDVFPTLPGPASVSDPLAGLTPAQLKALGGADPTDPYIRARLGIPQLPGSTLKVNGDFGVNDPTGVLAAEDAALAEEAAARGDADAFGGLATVQDPNGVLAAEDAAIAEEAAARGDADAFTSLGTDPTGVLAAEDAAIAEQQAAQSDAEAFENLSRGPADPTGVLAAEDAAIAAQQAAEDDADAFRINRAVEDPNGVLAAEDAAIAEQEAAQGDADAFGGLGTVQDPTGVLAAEDAALAEQAAAQGDADAFAGLGTVQDPTGVLAAEDAALAEEAAAQGDVEAFNQLQEQQQLAAQKQAALDQARAQNTIAAQRKNANNADWRVKLRLAPQANYLYAAPNPGILAPLKAQGGVIFPYTPSISTGYKATYSSYDLTHSNYKGYYYQSSAVDAVTLSCPFTAQSTVEADYLLAVIHFFKAVTKMFYGQDAERGTPPPLVYLTGLGEYQFNEHPCLVQSFTYELPTDVDYIRARSPNVNNSNMLQQRQSNNGSTVGTTWGGGILGPLLGGAIDRLANAGLPKGGTTTQPAPKTLGLVSPTYVPTKINISISLLPVQSRKQQSQNFSLRQYANGDLLKGGFW